MQHLDIHIGRSRYLLCEPQATPDGRPSGYGNLVRHIEQTIRSAAALGATVFLIKPRYPLNPALFDLESPDVRIIGQRGWRAPMLKALWWAATPFHYDAPFEWFLSGAAARTRTVVEAAKGRVRRRGWRNLDRLLDRFGHRCRDVANGYEQRVTRAWHALFAEARERARATDSKRHRVRLHLRPDAQREVDRLAKEAGLDAARPLVTLHVRESGFRQRDAARQRDLDRIREAHVDAYRPAVDWLVGRGYQVVRIGDSTMTPCRWPGVVDLATAPWRTGAFELWSVFRSRFFIASDSGPYFLSQLGGVPCLSVNVIQVGYYMLRSSDRYICKRVYDRAQGRCLSMTEMLTEEFIRTPLDLGRYEWIENTPEEIGEAVEDLVASLDHSKVARTAAQQRHDQLLAELAARWKPEWRSRRSLLFRRGGPGTISARFAARYLDEAPVSRLEPDPRMR